VTGTQDALGEKVIFRKSGKTSGDSSLTNRVAQGIFNVVRTKDGVDVTGDFKTDIPFSKLSSGKALNNCYSPWLNKNYKDFLADEQDYELCKKAIKDNDQEARNTLKQNKIDYKLFDVERIAQFYDKTPEQIKKLKAIGDFADPYLKAIYQIKDEKIVSIDFDNIDCLDLNPSKLFPCWFIPLVAVLNSL